MSGSPGQSGRSEDLDGSPTRHAGTNGLRQVVPGVELIEIIGRGGFAVVYRARHLGMGREVAVKLDGRLLEDPRNRRRFLREATAAGQISGHPHVVSLIDAGEASDGRAYLVMEYCPGGSLADVLRAGGPLPAENAVRVGLAITSALAAAHEADILHRDIKPANVLIDAYGTPRLSDFGLAAFISADGDSSVTLEALTPGYASPEAFSLAEPTKRSDVWSMGATLHAMISLSSPRRTADGSPAPLDQVLSHLNDPLPLPQLPGAEPFLAVIRRATAQAPQDRYADGRELYAALQAAADEMRVGGGVGGLLPPMAPPPAASPVEATVSRAGASGTAGRRTGLLVGLAMGAVALLVVGVIAASWMRDRGESPGSSALAGTQTPSQAGSPSETGSPIQTPESSASDQAQTPLSPGTCFGGLTVIGGEEATAGIADCDRPHFWEAYAGGVLSAATETPSYRLAQLDPTVRATCTKDALAAYLGAPPQGYVREVLPPSVIDWSAGGRTFVCLAAKRGAGEVSHPLR